MSQIHLWILIMKSKTKPERCMKTIMTKFDESLECRDDLTCEMSAGMLMLVVGRRPQLGGRAVRVSSQHGGWLNPSTWSERARHKPQCLAWPDHGSHTATSATSLWLNGPYSRWQETTKGLEKQEVTRGHLGDWLAHWSTGKMGPF